MKINKEKLCYHMETARFDDWEAKKIVKVLVEIGYGGVEWTSVHFNPKKEIKYLISMIDMTHKLGLNVPAISIYKDFAGLKGEALIEAIEYVKEGIEKTSKVGVPIVNVCSGWPTSDIKEGAVWNKVINVFEKLVNSAEKNSIYLCIEAVFGNVVRDYYTIRELLRKIKSPNLKITFDPSHYKLYCNDIPWIIKEFGDLIKHVHLKDVIGKPGNMFETFMFPLLGEGSIEWKEFFLALQGIGYDGYYTAEFESFHYFDNILNGDPVKAAELSFKLIKRLIDKVIK
ncbi:MAG: sugar phosphate isomerase/epimerase [Actinobacteria bacterium]|nr:sugar phosphate isomerase/epimerase [Actinomycetota bacterium]